MKPVFAKKAARPDPELLTLKAELLEAQGDLAQAYRQFDQALDPELVGEVLAVIRDLADGGMTMVMATHQMDFARALATEIIFMEHGRLIEQGAPQDLLAEGAATRTRDFCQRLLEMGA